MKGETVRHANARQTSAVLIIPLLVALLIFSGCTTSRLWDGNPNKSRVRTANIIPASIDNIYLNGDGIIAIPYKLSTAQKISSDEKFFTPYKEGYFYGTGGEEVFGDYKHRYSYFIPYQIINGPIDLRINSVSLVFSANYKSNFNKSWMEKELQRIQYLRYSPRKPEDLSIPHGEVIRDYFLNIDIVFTAPDNFIQITSDINPQEIKAPIDDDNRSQIMLYYQFAEKFIMPRSGKYNEDREYIEVASTVQPVGWLLANGQVSASLNGTAPSVVVGIVVARITKRSNIERIKITFNGTASKDNIYHYGSLISYGTDDGFQTSLGKYNNLLMQNMNVNGMKPLFAKGHNYPLSFEFHDDVTERITLPTVVKVLLTPITVVADIVLTPLFAIVSYVMEGMPR